MRHSCTHRACRIALQSRRRCLLLNDGVAPAGQGRIALDPISSSQSLGSSSNSAAWHDARAARQATTASTTAPAPTQMNERRPNRSSKFSKLSASSPLTPTLPVPAIRHHHQRRNFHDYFVTHLPSSSLHPDQRSSSGPGHKLPRDASKPHVAGKDGPNPTPAPLHGDTRNTTVVRIPLAKAHHHFGAAWSRGERPYNEDAYQAGVIEIPTFAKRAPISLTRAPASSPLAEYRRRQAQGQQQQEQEKKKEDKVDDKSRQDNEGAPTPSGDPQVFYFGVFDGHGGDECSKFLQKRLHEYIEDAAKSFDLQSSLKHSPLPQPRRPPGVASSSVTDPSPPPSKVTDPKRPESGTKDNSEAPKSQPAAEQGVNQEKALSLEKELLRSWRTLVGGYFRRLDPEQFHDKEDANKSGRDISTVITYAFLQADFDFISAQAKKPADGQQHDSVVADQAINATDSLTDSMVKIGGSRRFEGGSTCSVALVSTPTPTPFWHPSTPSTVLVAHVGDTRILLCRTRDGLAVPVTSNHHPSNPGEERRLRRYSGQVVTDSFGEERISGLANTRAFGDMRSKRIGVSAEPEVTRLEMAAAEYSFLVLMSDGVCGTLSDQEVVDIVKEARTPEQAARDLVNFATDVTPEADNATALVVRLGGWERRMEGGVGSMGTKEAREWRREEATDPRSRTR